MTTRISFLCLVISFLLVVPEAKAENPSVGVSPKTGQVRVDSTITIVVQIANVVNLHGYSVTLKYDAALFRCQATRKGAFLTSTLFMTNIDSVNGQVTLDEAILGQATKSGSGNLAEVDLQPKKSGTCTIDILKADLRDQANQTIIATTIGGSVSVMPIGPTQQSVGVQSGWNLISLPLRAQDSTVTACFPSAQSSAFRFENGYVSSSTLSWGTGYWLKFSSATTATISGAVPTTRTVAVREGWNIIGPGELETSVSSVTTSPASIIVSNYFGYSTGYFTTTTLTPGRGYWVKTSQAGTISLGGGTAKMPPLVNDAEEAPILVDFTDATNAHGTLMFSHRVVTQNVELPPLPPSGIFDVRFAGDRYLATLDGMEHEVRMQSVVYPLTVTARHLNDRALGLRWGAGSEGTEQTLAEGKPLVIRTPATSLYLKSNLAGENPEGFVLEQNFPNPFNPKTGIRYQVPGFSHVRLAVYDLLGREVACLVNEMRTPGSYAVTFDARNLASGVYMYRLQVGEKVQTRSMVLMK